MEMQMQPVDPNKKMNVTLTAQEWNVVSAALQELPYRVSAPIIDILMAQLRGQTQVLSDQQMSDRLDNTGE